VSADYSDDAAVVRLPSDPQYALVLTADVIAPIVDDPRVFGKIAAANSLSDVYAMGGRPAQALNLVFFPDDSLAKEVLVEILAGAAEICAQAGVVVVGGHTVRDSEVKFGLSVTGFVPTDRILSNRIGRAGDDLILTKPLGTGIVGTAIKKGLASAEELDTAVHSMTTLNGPALAVMLDYDVSACTDVTGFGLLGHLRNILRGSNLDACIELGSLPLLPGARTHAEAGRVPGGSCANLSFVKPALIFEGTEDPLLTLLAADAQTSGGLLVAVAKPDTNPLLNRLAEAGINATRIGELTAPTAAPGMMTLRS